jgi:imidazole glycerol-phosphate synthase subunit HisH
MTESYEFGQHRGLGFIEGPVIRFNNPIGPTGPLKVPQISWNQIYNKGEWSSTPVESLRDGEYMYFVHSFYAKPVDPGVVLSVTRYGNIEFCSSLKYRNIFAAQFHPERSGQQGLQIYRNIASLVQK